MGSALTAMFGSSTRISSFGLNILDVGGGDGSRVERDYPDCHYTILDLKHGYDVMKHGLRDGDWDLIFANHFIEHVSDPDFFLDECRRVMRKHTILEIGTPNLAAWFNRVLFLFGYVPHSVELSRRFNVGKPFNWGDEELGGHIYVYTIPALLQLLHYHGFRILSVRGESSTYPAHPVVMAFDKILTKVNRNFASAMRIQCRI